MALEYKEIASALEEINEPKFRAQLRQLSGDCPSCGRSRIHTALQKLAGQTDGNCATCSAESKEWATTLVRFWELIGAPREELKIMLRSADLMVSIQRLVKAIGKWGLHYPLIMPTTVKWEITNLCNLRCKHCVVSAGRELDNELSTEEALGLVDQCVSAGARNLGILGGEPLLRRDLFTIIDYASSNGLDVALGTNAFNVSEELVRKIADAPLQDLSISVDGIGDVHDEFRGRKGAFESTIQAIKQLVECSDVPFTVSAVVSKHNLHQVGDIIDLAVELGASKFAANDLVPIGRAQYLRDLCMSQEEFDRLSEFVDEKRKQYGDQIKLAWLGVGNNPNWPDSERGPLLISKCGAGLTELTVGADGTVRPCPFLRPTTENIRERSLEEIWFNSDQLRICQDRVNLKGKCGRCTMKYSCGGCRARAESFLNDPLGPDIRCSLNYIMPRLQPTAHV
jgi:radical SAM protein with 4Fe4S-binding SPASM domain